MYEGACLQPALELFCELLLAADNRIGDAYGSMVTQAMLFIDSVMRNAGYRGRASAGVTLTAASRDQVEPCAQFPARQSVMARSTR